jgi:hypothetical protein
MRVRRAEEDDGEYGGPVEGYKPFHSTGHRERSALDRQD